MAFNELEVDILKRVMGFSEREQIGTGGDERSGDRRCGHRDVGDVQLVAGGTIGPPGRHALCRSEHGCRVSERSCGPDGQGSSEETIPQFIRPANGQQRGVENGDAIAQPFGLFEAMGGEEDRDPRRRKSSMMPWTSLVATGSSPEVGSSRKSTSGSLNSARANETR